MITIPEQKLKSVIDYILDFISDDYNTQTNKNNSLLYRMLGGISLNDYNYYNNAVSLFVKDNDNSRKIECHLFFNKQRASLPTIHIGLPSENPGPQDGVGFDPSQVATPIVDKDEIVGYSVQPNSERSFSAKYNIVFTSANTFEVLLMYYVFKNIMTGNVYFLEMNSLRNPRFSGGDILLDERLVPDTIYARALFLDCFYETTSPSIDLLTPIKDIVGEGNPISE